MAHTVEHVVEVNYSKKIKNNIKQNHTKFRSADLGGHALSDLRMVFKYICTSIMIGADFDF